MKGWIRITLFSSWLAAAAVCSGLAAEEVLDSKLAKKSPDDTTLWYDVRHLGIEGKGWSQTKAPYDRLPAKAEGVVRAAVWGLSRHSAGMCVRFVTDATTIQARWTLTSSRLAMPHMPATGVSGLDLYVKTENGRWRWLATGRPTKFPTNSVRLVGDIPAGKRDYLLYLPLYNGVSSVEIGIPKTNQLAKAKPRDPARSKPIVFYGTSITQGGCASRTGMVHTAILGRRLDRPVINLGFSGNGRMEPELGQLLAELDPAVYVLDCLPNMDGNLVSQRVEPVVHTIRKAHPNTPILLVEDRSYANSFLVKARQQRNAENRKALRKVYARLQAAGIKHVYYLPGANLLGEDGEDTVDGSHPTDLGFVRQADAFQKALEPILAGAKQ